MTADQSAFDLLGIGECMLELRDAVDQPLRLSFGGDVLNTLVYAQRTGIRSAFATATGDDHYGHWLRSQWEAEGINCDLVNHHPGLSPALYIIRNSDSGERSFHYWRDASPFGHLLDQPAYNERLSEQLALSKWVYLSGITLAMLSDARRDQLLDIIARARSQGTQVAFDPNYRARLWQDVASARSWLHRGYQCASLALPSLDDERDLHDAPLHSQLLADRLSRLGVAEVVVKDGERGSQIFVDGHMLSVPAGAAPHVLDTTSAGDAYNGAYLAARIQGRSAPEAGKAAAAQAAYVVQHPGAIAPLMAD